MAKRTRIKLSKRLAKLVNPQTFKRDFKEVRKEVGLFLVGKSESNKLPDSSGSVPSSERLSKVPLARGFGVWKGQGNKRTKRYEKHVDATGGSPYSPRYDKFKRAGGHRHYLFVTGKLFDDSTKDAQVRIIGNKITVKIATRSQKIAQAHNKGTATMPKREFYKLDDSDKIEIGLLIKKKLISQYRGRRT